MANHSNDHASEAKPAISARDNANRAEPNHAVFRPLFTENGGVLGHLSDANASDLFDVALERQIAALSLLCALREIKDGYESYGDALGFCLDALWILSKDAVLLHKRAHEAEHKNAQP